MNLKNKKHLIGKVLGVGRGRIALDENRLEEIKEAITRQDVRELKERGLIIVKEKKGRRKKKKRKTKRRGGSRRKRPKNRKREYMHMVRKQRKYLKIMKDEGVIDRDKYYKLRNDIKARKFKDLKRLKQEVNSEE